MNDYLYVTELEAKLVKAERQRDELLGVLMNETMLLADLAAMADPVETECYMTAVYDAIAKVGRGE